MRTLAGEEQSELDRAKDELALARAFRLGGHRDSAWHYLRTVLPVAERLRADSLLARIYQQQGYLYGREGDHVATLEARQRAIRYYTKLGDDMRAGDMHNSTAFTYKKLGDARNLPTYYEQGYEHARRARELFLGLQDTFGLIELAVNTGILLKDLGRLAEAAQTYREGLRLAGEFGRTDEYIGVLHADLAEVLMVMDRDYDGAIEQLELALANYRENDERQSTEHAYRNLARAYSQKGRHDLALAYGQQSIAEAEEQGDFHRLVNAYGAFAGVQERAGDYAGALASLRHANRYQDSVLTERQNELIADLDAKYETRSKELTIDAQASELRFSRRVQYFAFGGVLLFAIVAVVLYRTARFRQRANQELAAQKAVIERKNEQNEALVKEVHHRVKNNLQVVSSLLSLQSASLSDAGAKEAMRIGQNRVRSMALLHQNLYQKDELTTIDMEDYVDQLVDNVADSFGIDEDGRIGIDNEIFDISLDVDEAIPLGLIMNELLTNAIKYAFPGGRTGRIVVDLTEREGSLVLSVADDGVGMAAAGERTDSTSFGTRLLDILARKVGGELRVEQRDGTRVELVFPDRRP